jgi:hypothetical protein
LGKLIREEAVVEKFVPDQREHKRKDIGGIKHGLYPAMRGKVVMGRGNECGCILVA